jgi:hypothetical protein
MAAPEPVQINSAPAAAWYDQDQHKLYVRDPVTVQRGDLVTVRGAEHRVIEVAYWFGAGTVCDLEPGEAYLPDTVRLYRVTPAAFDTVAGEYPPDVITEIYSGPGRITVNDTASASEMDLMERRNELVRYEVAIPLEVVDLLQGDRIDILVSRDPRLLTRTLHTIRVLSGSHAQERIVMAAERQE